MKYLFNFFIVATVCFCTTKKNDVQSNDISLINERHQIYGSKLDVPTELYDSVKWMVSVQYCDVKNGDATLGEYELVFDTAKFVKKLLPYELLRSHANCSDSLEVYIFYYRELLGTLDRTLMLYTEGGALYNYQKKKFCCFRVNSDFVVFATDLERYRKKKLKKKILDRSIWELENRDEFKDYLSNYAAKIHRWFRLAAMKRGYLPMDFFYLVQERIPWLEKVNSTI